MNYTEWKEDDPAHIVTLNQEEMDLRTCITTAPNVTTLAMHTRDIRLA